MGEKAFPKATILSIWAGWLFLVLPRMVIPSLLPLIERDFTLSHGEAALLMSVYTFPYALMQIPAGSLSDRFGKKYFVVISIFGTCLATSLMAFTKTFDGLLALRIISGLIGGMFYAPSTAYVVQSVDSKDVGMALGLVFTGGALSNVVISMLINLLPVEEYGWRIFFLLCSIPGALFAPFLLLLLRDKKGELKASREALDVKIFWRGLKSPQLALVLAYNFISSLSGWSLMTFLPTFYVLERGFTISEAALLMMIYYMTSMLSGPLSGVATMKMGLRVPNIISAVTMCVFSYTVPLSRTWVAIIFMLGLWALLGGLSWTACNALTSELAPRAFQGTFLGVFNLTGFLSGTFGPAIFGRVADTAGFEAFFMLSFLLHIVSLGISIIIMLFPKFSPKWKSKE